MATTTAAAAQAVAKARPNFRVGAKKVFLPGHVITLVPPKESQPPTHATFLVPLKFNKLDLRDYLWHAYSVEVLKVRSWINAQAPRQKHEVPGSAKPAFGPWYRPQSKKMMTAELRKPFVYPKLPEDLKPWDQDLHERMRAQQDLDVERQERRKKNDFGLREDDVMPSYRVELARQAQALLRGEQKWTNQVKLDEKWQQHQS